MFGRRRLAVEMFLVDAFYARLKKFPVVGTLLAFAENRPRLAAWMVLSIGIVGLLLITARDVGLLVGQWIALIIASVLVAGACIWIVSWEDAEEAATPNE
ncbi:MAG TPA: hypothetical protein PLD47_07800 [Aggregatilineales bacterium]|nr:hypothetical protein [Anaerolineales bacterium]HRE47611.1 hypothetical protein [Aggregatilineales bacterium]